MKKLTCSFIGHRNIVATEELKMTLTNTIENLIINYNTQIFLFGSNSTFNSLCHFVVTELKTKYQNIERIVYTCKSESCILENERQLWEELSSSICKKNIHLLSFENEYEHKTKYSASKASYIERNQAMLDNSDFCIFYYDKNYKPKNKNFSNRSGTALAYAYALRKKKHIINLFDL